MNARYPWRWKWGALIGAARLQLGAQRAGFADQPLDIDRHARRPVGLQLGQPVTELGDGSLPIASPPVIEANPDLQDALIEVAHRVRLMDPDALERLVLLEELLAVEPLDAVYQRIRGRVRSADRAARPRLLALRPNP